MYNIGFQVMNNLVLPDDNASEEMTQPSNSLLSRKPKSKEQSIMDLEPRERVNRYVADIRKARMGLKNG